MDIKYAEKYGYHGIITPAKETYTFASKRVNVGGGVIYKVYQFKFINHHLHRHTTNFTCRK